MPITSRVAKNAYLAFNRGLAMLPQLIHESCLICCIVLLAIATLASEGATAAETAQAVTLYPGYELGRGLKLNDAGLTLGGYATVEYNQLKDTDPRLTLSHTSLLLWWEGQGHFKFFSEVDLENAVATRYSSGDADARYLSLERLYLDYVFSDSLTLRFGKFLTPIGRWNLIHADPLTWTTSRPLVTQSVFPDNATGGMATGTVFALGQPIDYSLYVTSGQEFRADPKQDPFSDAQGIHVNVPLSDSSQIGFSYATFHQDGSPNEKKSLTGVDFLWSHNRYEISGEAVSRNSNPGSHREERGAFVQAVAPISDRLYAVGRVETFRSVGSITPIRLRLIGLVFRVNPALSIKMEFLNALHNDVAPQEGFMSSLSILF